MNSNISKTILKLYDKGNSTRKISKALNEQYGRESIRKSLKLSGASMRGRSTSYRPTNSFTQSESEDFAELLGYLYGDGCISKNKQVTHGGYSCTLVFATNEPDLVRRAANITQTLFKFKPRIICKQGYYVLRFRSSLAKYLAQFGYPVGKKSIINPELPMKFFSHAKLKMQFICGFLNAEASTHKTICVQQSIRIQVNYKTIQQLRMRGNVRTLNGRPCHFVAWSKARLILKPAEQSHILQGLQSLLQSLEIESKLYPVRVYVGKKGVVSIHYELRILPKCIKRVLLLKLITCTKKVQKLQLISRRCRSG